MRADRLLAALLVLQRRGKVTAPELADELEVSVKTARRDLEALAMAGVPLYSLPGRHGGWQLVGGARTDLTGLSETEAKALFFLVGPAAEVNPAAKAALRKLLQAVPEPFRDVAWASSSSIVVDEAAWGGWSYRDPPHLDPLRHAIVERRQVELAYADRSGAPSTRIISPLGVVKKGQTWYLLADTDDGRRTFRVSRIHAVTVTDRPLVRSPDFDLAAEWEKVADSVNALRRSVKAHLRVQREYLTALRFQFGDDLEIRSELPDHRFDLTVAGSSPTMLAQQLAGWGTTIDILGPTSLQRELTRIGEELLSRDTTSRPRSSEVTPLA
jgi:predicted DNA-binding transcriptional regulator YafY